MPGDLSVNDFVAAVKVNDERKVDDYLQRLTPGQKEAIKNYSDDIGPSVMGYAITRENGPDFVVAKKIFGAFPNPEDRVKLLSHADVNGNNLFHIHAYHGNGEAVSFMYDEIAAAQDESQKTVIMAGTTEGRTPLHKAVQEGRENVVDIILARTPKGLIKEFIDAVDRRGYKASGYAVTIYHDKSQSNKFDIFFPVPEVCNRIGKKLADKLKESPELAEGADGATWGKRYPRGNNGVGQAVA